MWIAERKLKVECYFGLFECWWRAYEFGSCRIVVHVCLSLITCLDATQQTIGRIIKVPCLSLFLILYLFAAPNTQHIG